MCFEFNSYIQKTQLQVGKVNSYFDGLNMKFDLNENMLYGSSLYRGAMVLITPYGDDQRYLSKSHPIILKAGEATIIKLTEKQVWIDFYDCVFVKSFSY